MSESEYGRLSLFFFAIVINSAPIFTTWGLRRLVDVFELHLQADFVFADLASEQHDGFTTIARELSCPDKHAAPIALGASVLELWEIVFHDPSTFDK